MLSYNIKNHYIYHKPTNTEYIDNRNLMPQEQKGCSKGSKGCKDQLLISKVILQECQSRKKNLCMAWIDYQIAVDSVIHGWIINSLELIGINNKIIFFAKKAMSYWKTSMRLHREGKIVDNRRFRNKTQNLSRRLIVTADILHYLNPPHRAAEQVATVLFPCGLGNVVFRFFSVYLKVLSQGTRRGRSLQGPRSATTG